MRREQVRRNKELFDLNQRKKKAFFVIKPLVVKDYKEKML